MLRHKPESEQGWFYRTSEHAFNGMIAFYGTTLRWVLRHQTATLLVAQGLLPSAGYRRHPGYFRGAADDLFRRHGGTPAGPRPGDFARPGGRKPVVLHRYRRDQYDRQQRAHPDQLEAARRAPGQRRGGHPPPAIGTGQRRGHYPVHAAG